MIDLTPLDVRNKRGDFKKLMRGYDPQEVDVFLEIVADRLEALVRETLQLRERTQTLQERVNAQAEREQAVQDALVTAQELRADIRAQAQREADHVLKEADAEARRVLGEAETECRRMLAEAEAEVRSRMRGVERQLDQANDSIQELERRRVRFLKEYRGLLERELDVVEVESEKAPFEERAIDLDLGGSRGKRDRGSRTRGTAAPPTGTAATAAVVEEDAVDEPDAEKEGGDEAATMLDGSQDSISDVSGSDEGPVTSDDLPVEAAPVPVESLAGTGPDGPSVAVAPTTPVGRTEAPARVRPVAPPPAVGDEPTSLELELMAGAGSEEESDRFAGVPDLETVLAEAGMEEVTPPPLEEIEPPPQRGHDGGSDRSRDETLILFDPDHRDRKKR